MMITTGTESAGREGGREGRGKEQRRGGRGGVGREKSLRRVEYEQNVKL